MSDELVKRLRERIEYLKGLHGGLAFYGPSDAALDDKTADRIEELERQLATAQQRGR